MTAPSAPTSDSPVRLRILDGGHFWLDGGSMFGVIPRPLWEKHTPPDGQHRIRLACWCVLAEIGEQRVLIETGMGTDYSDKEREIYGLTDAWVVPSLEAVGVSPDAIDLVVVTHLHFDHAAGLVRPGDDGYALTFPNADVVVQKGEWQDALDNYSTTRSSYRADQLQPVAAAGRLRLVEGSVDVCEGIRVRVTPGHTRFHQSILITGPTRTACFVGELLPTIHHARPSYQMAYDLLPLETLRQKAALLEEAEREDWLLLLDHDPDHPVVTVGRSAQDRIVLRPTEARQEAIASDMQL